MAECSKRSNKNVTKKKKECGDIFTYLSKYLTCVMFHGICNEVEEVSCPNLCICVNWRYR
jgi:hypothetical protein